MTKQNEPKQKLQSGTLKKKRLTIRLNENEYKWLQNISDETGLAKSDVVRLSLHDDRDRRMLKSNLSKEDRDILIKWLMAVSTVYGKLKQELSNTGNNINQIASSLNSYDQVDASLIAKSISDYVDIIGFNEQIIRQQSKAVDDLWQLLK